MRAAGYRFVNGGTVGIDGPGDATSRIHADAASDVTLCGRPVVEVLGEVIDDVAWIMAACRICERAMKAES